MAKDKTSFVLYSDSKSIIDLLTNEQAGLLLKTLFAYVNDENPKIDSSIALVFEMIKLQLKRDLKKWEQTKEGRSIAGKASAEARRLAKLNEQKLTNSTNVNFVEQTSTNPTVSVSVNDSVSVSVNEKKEDNNIDSRKLKFAHTLKEFSDKYSRTMLTDFYNYWTETNDNGKKFRREMQKTWNLTLRLSKWESNQNNFNTKKQINEQFTNITSEIRRNNPNI